MIDFEKIRQTVLAELLSDYPPEGQRSGFQERAVSLDKEIVFVCCKVLKAYHDALKVQQDLPPSD